MGYGGCEPRIEGIVQCTKRYCTILRKLELSEDLTRTGTIYRYIAIRTWPIRVSIRLVPYRDTFRD